jgi:hypothetical protein
MLREEERTAPERTGRIYGAVCLFHAAATLLLRAGQGRAEECLWLCHVAEWATAFGFLARRPMLATAAIASILVIHLLWIADAVGLFLLGRGSLGIVFLDRGDACDWFVAAPHFYAAPVGAWLIARLGWARRGSWLIASAGFVLLLGVVRACSDPTLDVNAAFRPVAGMNEGIFADLHYLGPAPYLLGLVAGAGLGAFWPGAVLLQLLQRVVGPSASHSARYAPTAASSSASIGASSKFVMTAAATPD